jgi:hypothetical protein
MGLPPLEDLCWSQDSPLLRLWLSLDLQEPALPTAVIALELVEQRHLDLGSHFAFRKFDQYADRLFSKIQNMKYFERLLNPI